jgi:hypothetical protein
MANYKVDISERRQRTVKSKKTELPYEGAKQRVLFFTCDDNVTYELYKSSLWHLVEVGSPIDFDVELRLYGDQGQFPHWWVTNVYQPESPESESDIPKPERKYGRDEDKVDVRTAIMEIGQDLRAGLDVPMELRLARQVWLRSALHIQVKEVEGEIKPIDEPEIDEAIPDEEDRQLPMEPPRDDPGKTIIDEAFKERLNAAGFTKASLARYLNTTFQIPKEANVLNMLAKLNDLQYSLLETEIERRTSKGAA